MSWIASEVTENTSCAALNVLANLIGLITIVLAAGALAIICPPRHRLTNGTTNTSYLHSAGVCCQLSGRVLGVFDPRPRTGPCWNDHSALNDTGL